MTRKQVLKARRQERIEEAYKDGSLTPDDVKYRQEIKNKIKSGKLSRWTLVKGIDAKKTHRSGLPSSRIKKWSYNESSKQMEPIYGGVAFIQISTLDLLSKKIPL